MTEVQAKILRRVRKMITLANDAGATEGERDNALRAVHLTLAKYNLSFSQVEAARENEEESREQLQQAFLGKPWAIHISSAIARLYFCHYYYSHIREKKNTGPGTKALHTFVGRHSNVVTAQEMARFVVEAVHREAQRYQRYVGGTYKDYRAFAQGATTKIRHRVHEIELVARTEGLKAEPTDAAEPSAPSTALVVSTLYQKEDEANAQFMTAQKVVLKAGRSSTYAPGEKARAAGHEFGGTVSLNRQVTSTKQPRLK